MAKPGRSGATLTDLSVGAAMHQTLKGYWLPVCLSADVPRPDSDPIRVRLCEESYVCFRDTEGRVAILNEKCCHRGASLCLGRVEKGGIQCIYHGWRFDADGKILEMPNVSDPRVKEHIRQPAYPVHEAAGIIFVYLGPEEQAPPFPDLPFLHVPVEHTHCVISVASANFTQVLEGLLDSSHVGVLHSDLLKELGAGQGPAPVLGGYTRTQFSGQAADLAPKLEVQETEFGFRYAALRQVERPDKTIGTLARITTFAYPTTIFIPPGNIIMMASPVSSDRTHLFHIFWDAEVPFTPERKTEVEDYYGIGQLGMTYWGLSRETHDLPVSPRLANNWKQDRAAMRRGESFNGMYRFMAEDYAVAESMGGVQDLGPQNLVQADIAIAQFRRIMTRNAEAVARGEPPRCVVRPRCPSARAGWVESGRSWREWFEVDELA